MIPGRPMAHAAVTTLAVLAFLGSDDAAAQVTTPERGYVIEEFGRTTGAERVESPRDFIFAFTIGQFMPQVRSEPGLTSNPYWTAFENEPMWLWGGELVYSFFDRWGTLSAGLGASYGSVTGKGIVLETGERSKDETGLRILPTRLLLTYHLDVLDRYVSIPLVPYGKVGFAYTFWWSTRGDGNIARDPGHKARGAKTGYQLTLGVGVDLGWFDPALDREMDIGTGINNVYLTAEWTRITADNFEGKLGREGIVLGDDAFLFGLAMAF